MELKLVNLTKKYGDISVLNHVNLIMTPGVYGLCGPNGSGKSTITQFFDIVGTYTNADDV